MSDVSNDERVPRRDGGAGQGGGFLEAEVIGNADQAGLLEHDVFGQRAVDVAAQGAFDLGGSGRPVEPVLRKSSRRRGRPVATR